MSEAGARSLWRSRTPRCWRCSASFATWGEETARRKAASLGEGEQIGVIDGRSSGGRPCGAKVETGLCRTALRSGHGHVPTAVKLPLIPQNGVPPTHRKYGLNVPEAVNCGSAVPMDTESVGFP